MIELLDMGKHANFIWVSYALTFVVLVAHVVVPLMRRRRIAREITRRLRREERQTESTSS